jgi:hypothetical protein
MAVTMVALRLNVNAASHAEAGHKRLAQQADQQ